MPEEDLYRSKSFLDGDHLEASGLINEDLPDSMSFDYEKVRGCDNLDWGSLLLRKIHLGGKANQRRIGRLVTTGLHQEEAGSYYFRDAKNCQDQK